MDSGGHGQKLRGVADNGGRWLLGRSKLEQALIFIGGARGREMKVRKTKCPSCYLMGVNPERVDSAEESRSPWHFRSWNRGPEPTSGPRWSKWNSAACLVSGSGFAWWEFTLHLELASSFWQVWQSPGP